MDYEWGTQAATQQLTQPFDDPRRQGVRSGLSEQDESDVLCILMPSSGPALDVVKIISETAPQFILQRGEEEDFDDEELVHEGDAAGDASGVQKSTASTFDQSSRKNFKHGRGAKDIALRMSNSLRNPCRGFVFGRNAKHSDLVISPENAMKISNAHFHIFVNQHGVLMLEDTSRNGTIVDRNVLIGRPDPRKPSRHQSKRTLNQGAVIEMPTMEERGEDTIRFIVRFPPRDACQEQYNANLLNYLTALHNTESQMQMIAAHRDGTNPSPAMMMPFAALPMDVKVSPSTSILAAATGKHSHGLSWTGGDKYNIVSQIGKGAFAIVFKLSAVNNGAVYACKQIEKRRFIKDGVLHHKVHNEILVMKDLKHPNIVQFIEYFENREHIYIVMEFVAFGDLSSYTDRNTVMPEYMCQVMAAQIMSALLYLHRRKITHRDIKPDNILVANQNPFVFKLSDFGLSKIVDSKDTFLKSFCGTLNYCAPEIYPAYQRVKMGLHPTKRRRQGEPRKGTLPYETSVDTWSISAVLFHLLSGYTPFTGSMEDEGAPMLLNIMNMGPKWARLEQAGVSLQGVDFVKQGLVADPAERADERDMLRHVWLTGQDSFAQGIATGVIAGELAEEEEEEELDASQIRLNEEKAEVTAGADDDANDETVVFPEPKRYKYSDGANGVEDQGRAGGHIDIFGEAQRRQTEQDAQSTTDGVQAAEGLFAHVDESAVRKSSGVFGREVPSNEVSSASMSSVDFVHTIPEVQDDVSRGDGRLSDHEPSLSAVQHSSDDPQLPRTHDTMDKLSMVPALQESVQGGLVHQPEDEVLQADMIGGNQEENLRSNAATTRCFGRLVPTEGSIAAVTVDISAQAVTYGRDSRSDYVHPNKTEYRVPKHAFDISMWYPDIERDLAAGKMDWQDDPQLCAIISTRTSRYIRVNGVRLAQGKGCWLYGVLRTGDVVSIFEPVAWSSSAKAGGNSGDGVASSSTSRQHEFLQFRCEFHIGASKFPRRKDVDGDKFEVKREQVKWREYEGRRSREAAQ